MCRLIQTDVLLKDFFSALYKIGKLFVEQYVESFSKPPRHVILDADDTNANAYGAQQQTLFNAYYNEYCYMPLFIFDGVSKKLILPMLRPGRRNKSMNVSRILRRCQVFQGRPYVM